MPRQLSRVAVRAVAALVVSGLVLTFVQVRSPHRFVRTTDDMTLAGTWQVGAVVLVSDFGRVRFRFQLLVGVRERAPALVAQASKDEVNWQI